MATATSLRSILRRRDISSAPLSAFKSISGAKTKVTGTYLSPELGIITRPFSLRRFGTEIIGIDLGTTNSRVAAMDGETAIVIRNAEGSLSTPSVVAFNHNGELTVGGPAKRQAITKTKNTAFGTKRLIGRCFDDFETKKEMRMVPYNIVRALNGDAWVEANGQKYSPSQIAAFVLSKLKETAEDYLSDTVNEAIICVPSYFNDAQRDATEEAARIAGLNVRRIIDEPTAAAFSYGLGLHNRDGLIAVIDLGGGTFDVSILKIVVSDDSFECETKAQNGDAFLGGEDFDDAIVDFLISEFKRTDSVYLNNDIVALQRLREAAEKAKIELSTETQTEIDLPFITSNAYGAKHLNITLTRLKFEAQVNHLIERIKSICKECMEDARITTNKLDEVILVGGMSRVPIVQQVVAEIFGKTPIKVLDPDEAVAIGASYYGWLLLSR